jgi:hypothetical protein
MKLLLMTSLIGALAVLPSYLERLRARKPAD